MTFKKFRSPSSGKTIRICEYPETGDRIIEGAGELPLAVQAIEKEYGSLDSYLELHGYKEVARREAVMRYV